MERASSIETRKRILTAAEDCFASKGYDASGIEEISRKAGANKALIYYHFKNKEGLLLALYAQIMDEIKILVGKSITDSEEPSLESLKESLKGLIRFLHGKKQLLKILMMESLKGGKSGAVFMELARTLMQGELEQLDKGLHGNFKENVSRFLVHEFFTGFMPMYIYAVYGDAFSEHFEQDEDLTEEFFIDSFINSHLSHHNF